jgi:hypothetical protein
MERGKYDCTDGFCGALDCSVCSFDIYVESLIECTGCGDEIEEYLGREECAECYIETLENTIAKQENKIAQLGREISK